MPHGAQRRTKPARSTRRESSAKRGYGRKWRKYSKQFLTANPLCVRCLESGTTTAAACVDHIRPVQTADDPSFLRESNHQALCWSCHSKKTMTEDLRVGRSTSK